MTPTNTILDQAARCFTNARRELLSGAEMLHRISSEELWKGSFDSFSAYLEEDCQISQSFAAKLIRVFESYVLENKVPLARLRAVDSEKLYLALRLPGSAEERLVRAETWSRAEIKAELASSEGVDCKHEIIIKICGRCHARL